MLSELDFKFPPARTFPRHRHSPSSLRPSPHSVNRTTHRSTHQRHSPSSLRPSPHSVDRTTHRSTHPSLASATLPPTSIPLARLTPPSVSLPILSDPSQHLPKPRQRPTPETEETPAESVDVHRSQPTAATPYPRRLLCRQVCGQSRPDPSSFPPPSPASLSLSRWKPDASAPLRPEPTRP